MPEVKYKVVSLADVFLDNDNPRHDPIDAEPEIIARLVSHERVANLAGSIAKHGTSPLERMAVVLHPSARGKYTVVEGNRRLCALKLLRDPGRAPTAASKRQFEALKASGQSIPATLEVVVFADRQAARYWLSLRHEGELDGVGTRNWKAAEKARFNAQGSVAANPNAQALALLDYAQKEGVISPEQRAGLALTTVTRYLSNPVMRSTMGLVNNRDLVIDVEQAAFDKVVGHFLNDALSGKANSRTKSRDRLDYAKSLVKEGIAPTARVEPAVAIASLPGKKKKVERNSRHPDRRPYIVPSDFKLKSKDTVLLRVFSELSTIDPDVFPFAGGYLFRAFVEKAAYGYAKANGIGTNGKKLHQVISSACDKLRSEGITENQLKPFRVMATKIDEPTSPETLGASVHLTLLPTASSLKARWEELAPCIRLLLDRSS